MIYLASKCIHGPRWRELRATGIPIMSTWIDESAAGETSDWPNLWTRCIEEASSCDVLIVYREPDEVLKGAWVEVGAALVRARPVIGVGCDAFTVSRHPLFYCVRDMNAAVEKALDVIRK